MVDNVCLNAVRGISDLVIVPGLINVDFADVRTIMTGMGRALMGTGYGTGDKRAIEAAQQAISSPLLEDVSINGATGILLNITGGPDLTLAEMNEACSLIAGGGRPDANIIFGSVIDANAGDEVRITVIATGFNSHAQEQPTPGAGATATARGREGQMALPMQASAAHGAGPDHDGAAAAAVDEPVGTDVDPDAARWLRGAGAAPGATAARPSTSTSSTRAWSEVPPAAMGAIPTSAQSERPRVDAVGAPGTSGTSDGPGARRPPTRSAAGGRAVAQMQSPRPADELGVEESEFDKPTYLRRGLYAPE